VNAVNNRPKACGHAIRSWRGALAAFAFCAAAGVPALSVGQTPAASDAPLAAPEPVPEPVPEPPPAVALVLPLGSPVYARVAEAIKAGFVAAAELARAKVVVIPHGDGEVLAAFATAREQGARVVVGPLLREDIKALAAGDGPLPWTIALNQLEDGAALPERIYTLPLAIESESRQIARRAREDGAQTAAMVVADAPLPKRFASAFAAEWVLQGGVPPVTYRFDRSPEVLRTLKRELGKTPVDVVLLAVDGADAPLVKPYVGQVLAYASSQVNDRLPRERLRDLDGVRFVEVPWLATPDDPAFARVARKEFPNATLDRLYALGQDAFQVAWMFVDGPPQRLAIDGATGRLTLDPSRQIQREGTLLQYRAGELAPVPAR
jgi:outer membrane PBP1 activator LpoA protein